MTERQQMKERQQMTEKTTNDKKTTAPKYANIKPNYAQTRHRKTDNQKDSI